MNAPVESGWLLVPVGGQPRVPRHPKFFVRVGMLVSRLGRLLADCCWCWGWRLRADDVEALVNSSATAAKVRPTIARIVRVLGAATVLRMVAPGLVGE